MDNNEKLEYGADGKLTFYGACLDVRRNAQPIIKEFERMYDWIYYTRGGMIVGWVWFTLLILAFVMELTIRLNS